MSVSGVGAWASAPGAGMVKNFMNKKTKALKHSWQPMESAPKDGMTVLVAGFSSYGDRLTCATLASWSREGNRWGKADGGVWLEPTHWMPLPDARDALECVDGGDVSAGRVDETGVGGQKEVRRG